MNANIFKKFETKVEKVLNELDLTQRNFLKNHATFQVMINYRFQERK